MGAEALTIERFVVRGEGQVRHPDSDADRACHPELFRRP
jgi:hypothetical protein